MVDNLSTEARIQTLLEEARKYSYPEDTPGIKKRYKDTSLVLFKESQEDDTSRNYLTFGSRRSSTVSQYGNTPIVIRRSRSSNGGLAMVAEQVPSLRGRSSRSDYALVEAKEKEEESESDDEYNVSQSRSHIDENSTLDEDQSVTVDTGSISPSSQIQDLCCDDHHTQGGENKKSFSHYDLPLQHHLEDIAEATNRHADDPGKKHNKTSASSLDNDPGDTEKSSVEINNTDNSIAQNILSSNTKTSTGEKAVSQGITTHFFNNNEELEKKRNLVFTESTPTDISDTDHEAVLRDYVKGTSSTSKLITQEEGTLDTTKKQEEKPQLSSSNGCKYIELRIVEPSDVSYDENSRKEVCSVNAERTLTVNDVVKSDDDDDVVFIDANSPPLPRSKFSCSSPTGSVQAPQIHDELGCSRETIATPPKHRSKSYGESSSDLYDFGKDEDTCPSDDNFEDKDIPEEQEEPNALHRLPLRSPTPPKKSPMRSPRVPKVKKKNKDHTSSDEETQELHNGTRSASPVSKEKDSRFFSFSLKREKSKSSSFLHSKKGKERKKLSFVSVQQEDSVIMKPANNCGPETKNEDEASGKRVGIRSMAIDGTIKRNFIVIHPSDESDTIGLAPVTQPTSNKEVVLGSTPRALSSVKSHIADIKLDKLEALKKISCQGDIKEELSLCPGYSDSDGNSKNYSRFDRISRSLRLKDKSVDHKTLGSSKSLSSEPSMSGISEFPSKSPCVLSEVDCDSVNIPTQKVHVKSNTTVSTLCVLQ